MAKKKLRIIIAQSSLQDPTRFHYLDRRLFWGALVVAPLFWTFLAIIAFMTFKWEWMVRFFLLSLYP